MKTKTNIKQIFGQKVKEARKNKGYSQEEFAELLGLGVSTLSKIECAKSYPTVETIEKIIDVLEIEPYLLFVENKDFDIEKAYQTLIKTLSNLKEDKEKFKIAYDFIMQLKK